MSERNAAKCPYHDGITKGIDEIKGMQTETLKELKNGAVQFAKHGMDIAFLKKVVFGGIGVAVVAGLGALARVLLAGG